MNIVPIQPLPFVIERVSPRRVQLWAWFAGQASTQEGFDIVSTAFTGLWFDVALYDGYQWHIRDVQTNTNAFGVMLTLNNLFDMLDRVIHYWSEVAKGLDRHFPDLDPTWRRDVAELLSRAAGERHLLARLIVSHCQQWNLDVHLATQEYLAQLDQSQQ